MTLSRLTPTQKLEVLQPRWHDRKALLATYKVGTHNEVTFPKSPTLPGSYYVSGAVATKYPKESNGRIMCYAVPLDEFEPLERN